MSAVDAASPRLSPSSSVTAGAPALPRVLSPRSASISRSADGPRSEYACSAERLPLAASATDDDVAWTHNRRQLEASRINRRFAWGGLRFPDLSVNYAAARAWVGSLYRPGPAMPVVRVSPDAASFVAERYVEAFPAFRDPAVHSQVAAAVDGELSLYELFRLFCQNLPRPSRAHYFAEDNLLLLPPFVKRAGPEGRAWASLLLTAELSLLVQRVAWPRAFAALDEHAALTAALPIALLQQPKRAASLVAAYRQRAQRVAPFEVVAYGLARWVARQAHPHAPADIAPAPLRQHSRTQAPSSQPLAGLQATWQGFVGRQQEAWEEAAAAAGEKLITAVGACGDKANSILQALLADPSHVFGCLPHFFAEDLRWHSDGDQVSAGYLQFLGLTCEKSPEPRKPSPQSRRLAEQLRTKLGI